MSEIEKLSMGCRMKDKLGTIQRRVGRMNSLQLHQISLVNKIASNDRHVPTVFWHTTDWIIELTLVIKEATVEFGCKTRPWYVEKG